MNSIFRCGSAAIASVFLCITLVSSALGQKPDRSTEVTGVFEKIIKEDFATKRIEYDYFLRDDKNGHSYKLKFRRTPPEHWRTGQRVTVRGHAADQAIEVEAVTEEATEAQLPDVLAVAPKEQRRAAVIMVDLVDAKASARYTVDQIAQHIWLGNRSVDALYRTASIDQLSFQLDANNDGSPDVFGPYEIPYSGSSCEYYAWAQAAEAAAEAEGVDLSLYQHRVFVVPRYTDTACGWAGIANVGCGTWCRAWIAEGESPMVYAHELGHNLYMAHAGTDLDNDGQLDSTYGDFSDPMGGSRRWHVFNGAHTDQMGWYAAFPGSIATIVGDGIYDITATGIDPAVAAYPHILKIEKPDTNDYYYLSYRQPIGYDDTLSSTYTPGVNIHRYQGNGYGLTYFVRALNDGETFTDDINGITVSQINHDGESVAVDISFDVNGGTSCVATSPGISISPAGQTVTPGSVVHYSVQVGNTDSASCASTTFTLTYSGAGSGSLSPSWLTMDPGETGFADIHVSTSGLADGNHPFEVRANDSDGADPQHSSIAVGSATIVTDATPPSTPGGLSGSTSGSGNVQLNWNGATDTVSGVGLYTVDRDGVAIGSTAITSFTDDNVMGGATYSYTVTAIDRVGNRSGKSDPIKVTVPSINSGNGTLHVDDLDRNSFSQKKYWSAEVTVAVHDSGDSPVANARVTGAWSGGSFGSVFCTTGSNGQCRVSKSNLAKRISSVTFTVMDIINDTLTYDGSANRDPDGDSNGTRITVTKP